MNKAIENTQTTNRHEDWFEFMHYEMCLEEFERRLAAGKDVRLVIDGDYFTSGYWIEPADSKKLPSEVASYTKETYPAFKQRLLEGLAKKKAGHINRPKGLIT